MTAAVGRRSAAAVVVALADLTEAMIGVFAYHVHRRSLAPGSTPWASVYLVGGEAGVGALILLFAVIAAGRSPVVVTAAATLAWLRLFAVVLVVVLMSVGIGFAFTVDAVDAFVFVLAGADAVAGALICTAIASRTRRGATETVTSEAVTDSRPQS